MPRAKDSQRRTSRTTSEVGTPWLVMAGFESVPEAERSSEGASNP
jgi:hypothetical protein